MARANPAAPHRAACIDDLPSGAGFENLGFGLYHSALEIWGKEISFGHSKRYKSGVFAVKPRRAQEYMPNTRFKTSIEIQTIMMSRHSMDKLLNR